MSESIELIEIQSTKQNLAIDSTLLSSVMSCARMTDFRHNHNFVSMRGKSVSLEMGSIVHKFLEVYLNKQIQGIRKSDAIEFGLNAAREYVNSNEVTNCQESDIEIAFTTIDQYLDYYKNDHWVPLEVETLKKKILYEDDEIRILYKVKYDLIADTNRGIFPVDHKTMKQRRDSVSLNNQFMAQCILANTRTIYINKIGFQTSIKPSEKFTRVPISYSPNRLIEWQSEILPYWGKMILMYNESGYWPPNYTHCENKFGFCQYKNVCESDTNMREETLGLEFIIGEKWDPQTEPK